MNMYMDELESLEDVSESILFEEEPSIFSDEHAVELVETAFHLMEEYMDEHPSLISEPHFHDLLLEEIKDMFYVQFEDHILESEYIEDDLNDLLEDAFHIFISTFHPERSVPMKEEEEEDMDDMDDIDKNDNIDSHPLHEHESTQHLLKQEIRDKIQALREIPQPVQRTPEWYQFRWNLITASNAWKAFETQSTINQLIYEKCQPLKDFSVQSMDEEIKLVNTNTTLHWGQKYEPLSVMMYEHLYDSKVEDFGCIQHPVYSFIGASPDGIIVESNTGRFGRMLEIKNIVNREITGIPKKEYWIQMQLQMEVCDLDECDFLETKFTEYPDYQSYHADSSIGMIEDQVFASCVTTKDGSYKGIIVQFFTNEGKPHYEYMPLSIWKPDDVSQWEEDIVQKYESEPYRYTFMKFIYWKLEKLSCVLVARNREWFQKNVKQLEKVWKIIEQERITGYEHRAPVRRAKKDPQPKSYTNSTYQSDVCFLKVVKLE